MLSWCVVLVCDRGVCSTGWFRFIMWGTIFRLDRTCGSGGWGGMFAMVSGLSLLRLWPRLMR